MYAKIKNKTIEKYPYSIADLKADNPGSSFPDFYEIPDEVMDHYTKDFNIVKVVEVARPSTNDHTKVVEEGAPTFDRKTKKWNQNWIVRDATQAELDTALKLIQNRIVVDTQFHLDDFARTRNYDNMLSACTYATSTNLKFQAEGQYCVEARDATWATLYDILADVEAGTRPVPQSFADIEADLPPLVWPN